MTNYFVLGHMIFVLVLNDMDLSFNVHAQTWEDAIDFLEQFRIANALLPDSLPGIVVEHNDAWIAYACNELMAYYFDPDWVLKSWRVLEALRPLLKPPIDSLNTYLIDRMGGFVLFLMVWAP
ncbi:hypothetical protein L1049_026474 [Liquidambar formosana]|uniref:Uncharacterized protein n=1 Tax=Liquidambar formosana TaxID=63359 RepID=A0AAP0NDH0_LIQFO